MTPSLEPGQYVHYRTQLDENVWCVGFGQITQVHEHRIRVNTGEEMLWVDISDVTYESERFQGKLI